MVRKNEFQGYTAFFSGHEYKREYGVGLLVKTSLAKGVRYTDYVDDRILIVAGIFRGTHQCIVSVYGPCRTGNPAYVDEIRILKFYDALYKALDKVPSEFRANTIIMGDYNARVGRTVPESDGIY